MILERFYVLKFSSILLQSFFSLIIILFTIKILIINLIKNYYIIIIICILNIFLKISIFFNIHIFKIHA